MNWTSAAGPAAYRNLDKLHARIKPRMLRRRKAEVETELPERTDRNHFVPLSAEQQGEYEGHEGVVAQLAAIAQRRPLTQQEQDKLLRHLNMMRMVCDTNYILNPEHRACPKIKELEKILEECRDNPDVKVIIFSEWERMLELARDLCRRLELGFAWHTGTVPQKRRRAEINLFKSDPALPGLPQHRFRRGGSEFAKRQRGHQLRLALESGQAGAAHRARLAQTPDPPRHRHQPHFRKHHRAPHARNPLQQAGAVRRRAGSQGRPRRNQAAQRTAGLPVQAATIDDRRRGQARLPVPSRRFPPTVLWASPKPPVSGSTAPSAVARSVIPLEGAHSVLYVVVERDAAQWREQLASLHQDYFGPGQSDPLAPVRLEVVDRATDEALQRLIEAGLVARTTRATRPLWPPDLAVLARRSRTRNARKPRPIAPRPRAN